MSPKETPPGNVTLRDLRLYRFGGNRLRRWPMPLGGFPVPTFNRGATGGGVARPPHEHSPLTKGFRPLHPSPSAHESIPSVTAASRHPTCCRAGCMRHLLHDVDSECLLHV